MMMNFKSIIVYLILAICGMTLSANAADLLTPTGKVILLVTGNIANTNGENKASMDRQMLNALEQRSLVVTTPWTEGEVTFSGPLLGDVLSKVGAKGEMIIAKALNDYSVKIPMVDAQEFDVILAMSMNGKKLSIRDKGPLWIIYPWGDDEDLKNETYYARSIWQLKNLDIQ